MLDRTRYRAPVSFDVVWKTAEHPNKEKDPNQRVFLVPVGGYIYFVPFVIEGDTVFLKIAFPHRKSTRDYLKERKENE